MRVSLGRGLHFHVARRAASLAACFVLAVMTVQMAPAAAVAKAPTTPPSTPAVTKTKSPEKVSGAKPKVNKPKPAPTEVTSLRTEYSDTFNNHDGTFTAAVSPSPINYQPSAGAAWAPIDLTMSAISGGNGRVRASKTPVQVEVGAPDDASGFVSVDTGKGKISLSLAPGAKPGKAGSKPVASNSRADVGGLLPGVDLRVVPGSDGFRLFLTLASRPTTASYTFTLASPGLTPTLQADGSISFADKTGAQVATMPAPYAIDSTPNQGLGGRYTQAVSYSLSNSGGKTLVTVSVDQSWLAAATYPVYVDPSVIKVSGTGSVQDTFVDAAYKTSNFHDWIGSDGYHEVAVGMDPTYSAEVCYGLFKFTLPAGVAGSTIDTATLNVYPQWQYEHYSAVTTWVNAITSSWSSTSVTWNSRPSNTNVTSATTTQGHMGTFNVTSTVQGWAANTATNNGLLLHENGNGGTYWKRFLASEQGGGNVPALNVTYSIPAASITAPLANGWLSASNPNVAWSYNGNGGPGQSQYQVQVASDSAFGTIVNDSGQVGGTGGTALSYAVPSNLMTDGHTYYFRVQVSDGTTWSPVAGAVSQFRWDSTPPVWKGFTAPTAQVDQTATSYAFVWNAATDAASGVANYEVVAQSTSLSSAGVCSSNFSTQISDTLITPTTYTLSGLVNNACYRVGVRAIDAAGTGGGAAAYSYSSPVLIDTTTSAGLGGPYVTDNCATIGSCYRSGSTIYFKPAGAKTITLTSSGSDLISGIKSYTFSPLTPTDPAWAYTPATVPGNPAVTGNPGSIQLTWSPAAGQVSLSVTMLDGAGVVSPATVITFTVDNGPELTFTKPAPAGINYAQPGSYTVSWGNETQGSSPITGHSLQRLTESGADGTCSANSWIADATDPASSAHPSVTDAGLLANTCYEWVETLTDLAGNHAFTSAPVLVDGTAPTLSITSPSAESVLRGTVTITGTASDAHFGATGSWALSWGVGVSPTKWNPIGNSSNTSITAGTLATWAPGSLSGVYSFQLTATDAAGNATPPVTTTVYLANTDRDATSVPFDMGGGWNLGVSVASGEASLSRSLFKVPSYGPAQALSLTYNSADASSTGMFGTGWSSNLTQYLDLSAAASGGGFIVWHQADGTVVPFGSTDGKAWTTLTGNYETLTSPTTSTYKITEPDQSSYSFASGGKLSAITDRYGVALNFNWAASSSTATATDASGRVTTITTAGSQVSKVTYSDCTVDAIANWGCAHAADRTWSFGYGDGNLHTVTDPAGNVTTLSDTSGALDVTRSLTAKTVDWTIDYDASGRVSKVIDPNEAAAGVSTSFGFGSTYATGATVVGEPGDTTFGTPALTTTYNLSDDARGLVSSFVSAWAGSSGPVNWTTSYTPWPDGSVKDETRQTDTAGHTAVTSFAYDGMGSVTAETDPDGVKTTNSYSKDGYENLVQRVVSGTQGVATAPSTTDYIYDSGHHLCLTVENPTVSLDSLTCSSSPLSGNADQNVENAFTYNAQNLLADQIDPLGIVTDHQYDTYGNEKSVKDNYKASGAVDDSTNVAKTYTYDIATGNVLTETDPIEAGSTTPAVAAVSATKTYTYNDFGSRVSEIDSGDDSIPSLKVVNTFDEFGNKTLTDQYTCTAASSSCSGWSLLNETTTTYDSLSRAKSATAVIPAVTMPNRDVLPEVDSSSSTVYDIVGNPTKMIGPDNSVTIKTYDGLGHLISTQAKGGTTSHSYNGLGDEVCAVAPSSLPGDWTTPNVAGCLSLTNQSMPPSTVTVRTLDVATGRLASEIDDATGSPTTTSYTYDALDRVATTTGPDGTVTTSTYDAQDRVIKSVVGTNETDTTYDRAGNVLTTSDPYDKTAASPAVTYTANVYDALGRTCRTVSDIVDLNGSLAGLSCRSTLSRTATTNLDSQTYFDAAGDAIASVDSAGIVDRTFYSVRGQVKEEIANCVDPGSSSPAACDPPNQSSDSTKNIETTNTFSATGGQLTSEPLTAGVEQDTIYDGAGHTLSSVTDKTGLDLVTDYHYDSSGRQVAQRSPAGVVTISQYDTNGYLADTIVDCVDSPAPAHWYDCGSSGPGPSDGTANQVTTYRYDSVGNTKTQTSPTGLVTAYTYDNSRHVLTVTENYVAHYTWSDQAVNLTTAMSYDTAGRKITTTSPTSVVTRTVYDTNGNVCRTIANITSAVDPATLTCTSALPALSHTATANIDTQYTYDGAGQKVAMIAPSPADGATPATTVTTLYAHDTAGHLCRVLENSTIGPAGLATLTNPCTDSLPTGAVTTTSQNVDTKYAYDDAGNMISQTSSGDPAAGDPAGTTSYGYDDRNRLKTVTDPDGNVTVYTYDAAGNRTSETDPGANGGTIYSSYDAANRLCQRATLTTLDNANYVAPVKPCKGTVAGTFNAVSHATTDTAYTYDPDGNQISATDVIGGESITASFDAADRPSDVTDSGAALTVPDTTYTYGTHADGTTSWGVLTRTDPVKSRDVV